MQKVLKEDLEKRQMIIGEIEYTHMKLSKLNLPTQNTKLSKISKIRKGKKVF